MKEYTAEKYIATFGEKMWQEKVLDGNEGYNIESVWATDNGNIFMVITGEN